MPKESATKSGSNGLDLGQVAETGQQSMAAFTALHRRAFRDAMTFNAELLEFARRRVGKNIETSDRLAHCQNMTQTLEVMSGFYQDAVDDYAAETTNLMKIGATMTTSPAEPEAKPAPVGEKTGK